MTPYVECTFNKNTMGMVCLIIMTYNIWCVLCLLNYRHSHVSNVNVLGENLYVVYCGCEKVENRGQNVVFFWICHFLWCTTSITSLPYFFIPWLSLPGRCCEFRYTPLLRRLTLETGYHGKCLSWDLIPQPTELHQLTLRCVMIKAPEPFSYKIQTCMKCIDINQKRFWTKSYYLQPWRFLPIRTLRIHMDCTFSTKI